MSEQEKIGELIRSTLKEQGRSVRWLAQQIGCTRVNVHDIFNRSYIEVVRLLTISLALKTNFFLYFSHSMTDKAGYASPKMCHISLKDKVHVGTLIKQKLNEEGYDVEWLLKRTDCGRNNLYDIVNSRTSVDTERLLSICNALKTNFFEYFIRVFESTITGEDKICKCKQCAGF